MKFKPLTFLSFCFISWSAIAQDAAVAPLAAKDPVAGVSQPELTKRWWQWAGSFEGSESPVSDRTGARCKAGQEGPIWFLAGVFGSDPAQRLCHVPSGKFLFFPVINYIVMPTSQGSLSCSEAIKSAREITDAPSKLFAELDGKSIEGLAQHRVASPACFNVGEKAAGQPMISPSASNGYWLALPPLAKGRHKLHFGGALPELQQDMTYTLIVE
jgi:hypothetical protein